MPTHRAGTDDRDSPAVLARRARAAAATAEQWDQARTDQVIRAVGREFYREDLVRRACALVVERTGMGSVADLVELHLLRVLGTLRDMHGQRSVGVIAQDAERGTTTWAKPLGTVALVTPATAPCTAVATSVLALLKTRNAVVVSAHPDTTEAVALLVDAVRAGLRRVGACPDLVQQLRGADRDASRRLMRLADLVIATGGAGTVARARTSGTPAVPSGPGNATVVVDEYADLPAAAAMIGRGAGFNNGTSCSSESNVLVQRDRLDAFRDALREHGALVLSEAETLRLEHGLWPQGRHARALVGQGAREIARACGIAVPGQGPSTLVATLPAVTARPLLTEKLAPVLTVVPYDDFDTATRLVQEILDRSGSGHSCALHTGRGPVAEARIARLAATVRACRVLVNQSTMGNAGSFQNGMEFTSVVSTGTWGGCGLSENVSWRHLYNRTTVARPLRAAIPNAAELLGEADLVPADRVPPDRVPADRVPADRAPVGEGLVGEDLAHGSGQPAGTAR